LLLVLPGLGQLFIEFFRRRIRAFAGGHLGHTHPPPRQVAVDHGLGQYLDINQRRYRLCARIGQRRLKLFHGADLISLAAIRRRAHGEIHRHQAAVELAALGVKLAEPSKEVYALVGDGSYMMLHSELATSIQERRKINVVLLDNMAFGCINNLQIGNGMDSFGTEFRFRNPESGKLDGGLVPVDFAMSAAAYGCKTYKVSTVEQLESALADARTQTVSTLIDIKVLPKTMIHGYLSWWRVGVAQVSTSERTNAAAKKLNEQLAKARQY
jgi:hypothetical protein